MSHAALSLVDLRSDTVTRPTPGMRAAMHAAEVGDDVFREDPTVNRLEQEAAALLGKPAAVFVPSGTMANQVALRLHTEHGDDVLCADGAHVKWYETGAAAALAGRFAPVWKVPARSLSAAVVGGVMLGYGARIAFGCNIGAYFSGVSSTSLHGWVWLASAFTGNIIGTRLRPWFGLSV